MELKHLLSKCFGAGSFHWCATVFLAIQLQSIVQFSSQPSANARSLESDITKIAEKRTTFEIGTNAANTHFEATAIPLRSQTAGTALNYHKMPVDLSKPISHEPMVKASDVGLSSKSFYYVADGSNGPYKRRIPGSLPDVWIRKSVANKLLKVNRELAPLDLEVHIYDGYRPIETQRSLWNHFVEKGRRQLKTSDPRKLREFAGKFASDPHGFNPTDSATWPTHNTGGAVDLTLRKKSTGKLLDMGGEFDEATPISFTDALERKGTFGKERTHRKEQRNIAARNNRRILYHAMTREGFANYPYEWWHYDYGTQMWSQNSSEVGTKAGTRAWYGPATFPRKQ